MREDPTIARTAALEFDRVWGLIEDATAAGTWFWKAREVTLAEEIPDIATAFGKVVATRVEIAVMRRGPEDMSPEARRALRDRRTADMMAEHIRARGKINPINRLFFHLTGTALW